LPHSWVQLPAACGLDRVFIPFKPEGQVMAYLINVFRSPSSPSNILLVVLFCLFVCLLL